MWVPYYSVHFDDATVGLRAYQLLREFSLQRQLSPPKEMITMNEKWLEQKRPKDPLEAEKFNEEMDKRVGCILDKKERARILMDQKATSVADIAAVLSIQEEELKDGFASGERGYLTRKARQRRRQGRKMEEEITQRAVERVQNFGEQVKSLTGLEVEDPAGINEYAVEPEQVKILWTDIHDAHWASSWPGRVNHGHLRQTSDHVMPGQKRRLTEGDEIIAHDGFVEKDVSSPSSSSKSLA